MCKEYRPDGMNIELTTCCPLHCPQCYCSLQGGKHIPLDVVKARLKEAAALGVRHVELSGGETMCYPHLYEAVAAARQLGIAPSIAVSGWHFDDEALEKLIDAGIDTISVSLNGPTKETNAWTRDGYELAIHALKTLQRHHFCDTLINWVMHRSSVEYLPEMIALARRYEVGVIVIIEPKSPYGGELSSYPTKAQLQAVADMVKHTRGDVELSVQHCFSPLLALSSENRLWGNTNQGRYKGCTAGICSFCVNVDGSFTPCRHLEYAEQWESLQAYWEKSSILQSLRTWDSGHAEPCISCHLSPYCRPCAALAGVPEDDGGGRVHCSLADSREP